jgi:hypothetical protein
MGWAIFGLGLRPMLVATKQEATTDGEGIEQNITVTN